MSVVVEEKESQAYVDVAKDAVDTSKLAVTMGWVRREAVRLHAEVVMQVLDPIERSLRSWLGDELGQVAQHPRHEC